MKEDKVISLINDTTKLNLFFDFKKIKSILSRIEDIINSCNTCELTMLYAKLIFTSSKVESNHVIKFIKDIDEFYGEFQAGEDIETKGPLTSYMFEDVEPGIVKERG